MSKMLSVTAVTLFFILGLFSLGFAQESLTITTYYPSPSGNYNELGTNKLAVDINGVAVPTEYAAMNNGDAHIGRSLIVGAGGGSGFAYDEGATTADGTVLIKGNVGIGTTTIGSKLQVNGNAVIGYSASTAGPTNGLAVSGNVGIGTNNPGTNKLEVVDGPIKATGGLIIETRTTDPASPAVGRMWLRTDL